LLLPNSFAAQQNTSQQKKKIPSEPSQEGQKFPKDVPPFSGVFSSHRAESAPFLLVGQKCFSSRWLNHPFEENMLVKMDHFPKFRGENEKYLSCHHLVFWGLTKNSSKMNQNDGYFKHFFLSEWGKIHE